LRLSAATASYRRHCPTHPCPLAISPRYEGKAKVFDAPVWALAGSR
jgi:hypothetical protein